jgi:hypothetical protein
MELMTGWKQQQQQDDGLGSNSLQPYNDVQRQKLQQTVLSWLQMPDDADSGDGGSSSILAQLPLSSVRQLRELLLAVKVGAAAVGAGRMCCAKFCSSVRRLGRMDIPGAHER